MAHYDGPAFARDGQKPDSTAPKAQEPITYHSVDPMSQFVTPPSVASRTSKAPVIDYADITAKMQREDEAVILMASSADDAGQGDEQAATAAVKPAIEPATTSTAAASADAAPVHVQSAPETPDATNAAHADITPETTPGHTATVSTAAAEATGQKSAQAAKREPRAVPEEEDWWPVELEPTQVVLRDDSPDWQQHRSTVSALTPRVAPLPDWNVTHDAVAAYLRQKQQ